VDVGNVRYSINADFQDQAIQLADALELDELESARVIIASADAANYLDRRQFAAAVIQFHEYRTYKLDCLRLLLQYASSPDLPEDMRHLFRRTVAFVLENKDGPGRGGPSFTRKCIGAMAAAETWLHTLAERAQRVLTLGQTTTPDADEILGFQQHNLTQQHESLGAIVAYLVKANFADPDVFLDLLGRMPGQDKWSILVVHYVPILTAFAGQFGSPEGGGTLAEARSIDAKILEGRESKPWLLPQLHAALVVWWLAE
jgi:nuclear pore complex protein Nup205